MKEVQVSVDDKNMNFTHGGVDYRNDDGVVTMPENVANQFIKADVPGVRKHSKLYSLGDHWDRIFGGKSNESAG